MRSTGKNLNSFPGLESGMGPGSSPGNSTRRKLRSSLTQTFACNSELCLPQYKQWHMMRVSRRTIWKRGNSWWLLIFTFECCILLRIYLTCSLWCRQSQQSFNTLTPFNFPFYSLHVSAPTGHPQVRYSISYLKNYFNTQCTPQWTHRLTHRAACVDTGPMTCLSDSSNLY
jgi:hypothetical protein